MTIKHIIGALFLASPFLYLAGCIIKEDGILFFLKLAGYVSTVILMVVIGGFLLSGCTTTKTVEVPVPVPCTKPKNIPIPHNYMAQLNAHNQHQDFIKACLATTESCFNAYNACALYQGDK